MPRADRRSARGHAPLALLVAAVLGMALSGRPGEAEPPASGPTHLGIAFDDRAGLLSVEARNVPLAELLRAVGEQASVTVLVSGDLEAPVSRAFADLPLEEGLRRLVGTVPMVMVYGAGESGRPRLAEVRVYADAGEGAIAPLPPPAAASDEKVGRAPLGGPEPADAAEPDGSAPSAYRP